MASVSIVRTSAGQIRKNTMGVKVENQPIISMITTPPKMSGAPGVWTISETARPGRQPLTQASAPGLRTLRMEHTVQSINPTQSIEHLIHPFRAIAESGKRLQFIGGGMLPTGTWWWVVGLDIEEIEKATDNRASRVILTWDLKEANQVKSVELSKTGVKKGTVTRATSGGTFVPAAGTVTRGN